MSRGCSTEDGCLGCTVQPDPVMCVPRGDASSNRFAAMNSCPTEAQSSAFWTLDFGPRLGGDSYQPDLYLQFIVLDRNRAQ